MIVNLSWDHVGQGLGNPTAAIYAAAKGGVAAMSRCLAREFAPRVRVNVVAPGWIQTKWLAGAIAFQFLVGVYGGYFGAGIGILMLAALGILGLKDIHEMNSLKVVFGGSINGIAAAYFIWAHMVYWPDVLIMAIGAIAGGWGGAGVARKLGRVAVRRIVIGIGFAMAISLFIRK